MHNLQPKHKSQAKKRIGRGDRKRGTYSGRGIKGQRARAGVSQLAFFAGGAPTLTGMGDKFAHKLRGDGNNVPSNNFRKWKKDLNIEDLDTYFAQGEKVDLKTLYEKGLISKTIREVKILGRGSSDKQFVFGAEVKLSKSVAENYSLS